MVKSVICQSKAEVFCLQETKLVAIDVNAAISFADNRFENFVFKESVGAVGGIVTMWDETSYYWVHSEVLIFGMLVILKHKVLGQKFGLVNIYGPCEQSRHHV